MVYASRFVKVSSGVHAFVTEVVSHTDPYADIRPFRDDEVAAVLARVAGSPELAGALARLRLPRLERFWPALARGLVSRWLRLRLDGVTTVAGFQALIEPHLRHVIEDTSTFTVSGLEALDIDTSWLFVSNHRDIVMDPAYANYALHRAGHRTLTIAIGNNLLREAWVSDLMRLNKSFIVRRDVKAPRELLAASKQLSGFIRDQITGNGGPVWIAQREGRAKDGCDGTDSAVIKMFTLSRDRQTESPGAVLGQLNIVPLAVSYELDPCDGMKAAERAAGPHYTKADDEDIRSIGTGITGRKGAVHLAFGSPIRGSEPDIDAVTREIDRQITACYALFPTNVWAWERLEGRSLGDEAGPIHPGTVSGPAAFHARIERLPVAHQKLALEAYANPVRAAIRQRKGVV